MPEFVRLPCRENKAPNFPIKPGEWFYISPSSVAKIHQFGGEIGAPNCMLRIHLRNGDTELVAGDDVSLMLRVIGA